MSWPSVVISDSTALIQIARGEKITTRGFFTRLRPLVTEPEDLLSYTKRSSAIYRGVLNLLGYAAEGLRDWNNTQVITTGMQLEDHHIYPRAYIAAKPPLDIDQDEAEQLVDCVVNRTLIPKLTNIHLGKKPPQVYLSEVQQTNGQLATCLPDHLIPADLITDTEWNGFFKLFLDERANAIFSLIERYAISPTESIVNRYSAQAEGGEVTVSAKKPRLADLIAMGRVAPGDRVYMRRAPQRVAEIIDGETVRFEGKQVAINQWGQQLTGWNSINIYESVFLERTQQPLKLLR